MLAVAAAQVLCSGSTAEVTSVGASGFEVREQVHIAAAPAAVYAALVTPGRWWDSKHTYSGNAARLTLDARAGGCWCETSADGGSAQHLTVVYAAPGKALRLRGALGPLQSMGGDGSLTFTVTSAGSGTDLKLIYAVGGYAKDGFDELSKAVDSVLGHQADRLKRWGEAGTPESAPP